ncbi:hypothetical protein PMAYCL1PPCAC_25034 [Pristionchus mayeri]|uniref:Uncharacterized protein n=1 Tax=Pristionchus mayeri TaxID=1317129 RepID=A0AAN5I803_9BILA|nr:hypothetical protein PMAYCL1PPCAC_25034 [Pristionchus mayeri]
MPRLLLSIIVVAVVFMPSVYGGFLWSESDYTCLYNGYYRSGLTCPRTGVFSYYTCCHASYYECCFNLQGWVIFIIASILSCLLISCFCAAIGCIFRRN